MEVPVALGWICGIVRPLISIPTRFVLRGPTGMRKASKQKTFGKLGA